MLPTLRRGTWIVLALAVTLARVEAQEERAPAALDAGLDAARPEDARPAPEPPAERGVSPLHSLRYTYANDTFTSTDYYYTQGMGLSWTSPLLADSPLAIPLPDLGPGSLRQVSLSWRYEGFTPIEYQLPEIQVGDRPFASFMYLAHRSERLSPGGELSLWAQWALGWLGPSVGGREFQAEIHRSIKGKRPLGWRNQLHDELIAQLEVGATQRLFRYAALCDLRLEARLRGGNLYVDGELSARLRCGILGPPLGPPDSLRLYAWALGGARGVAHNTTLQGGLRDSAYTLGAGDVRRLVGFGQLGATLEYGAFGLSYSVSFLSPELRGGRSHAWGELGLSVFFG